MTNPCTSTAKNGRLLKVYISDNATPTEAWTLIGGVDETGIKYNNEAIDTTSFDDNGWQSFLCDAGTRSIEASISGVLKAETLFSIFESGEMCQRIKIERPSGKDVVGCFLIEGYEEKGSMKDVIKYSATLKSSGAPTFQA